jgi:hypothetical protein
METVPTVTPLAVVADNDPTENRMPASPPQDHGRVLAALCSIRHYERLSSDLNAGHSAVG